MKYSATSLAVVVTLLLLPPAFALNCNYLTGFEKDTCSQIDGLPLSEEEKEITLTASLKEDRSTPNHYFVNSWNNQIQMRTAPQEVSTRNEGVIRDAWIKIASIMPSVLENDTLYVDKIGKIQSFYNYRIEIPTGTASGDCKTIYSLANQDSQLQLFLNNILVGNNKLSNYQTSENGDLNFLAQITINAQTKIEHYQDYTYCSQYYKGSKKCRTYSTECRYSNTEYKNDQLILTDYVKAKTFPNIPSYNFQTLNDYGSSIKGLVNANNYTSFLLSFKDASYKETNYIYDYVYSLKPYNVLTIRATPLFQGTTNNINIKHLSNSSFEFIVNNKQNCQITLFTHFSNNSYSCFPEITLKGLSITTDKLHYFTNESIKVEIEPKGMPVKLNYGNTTYIVSDSISLQANPHYSRVIASYDDEQALQVVSVTEKDNLVLASKIGLFFFINYIIFSFLTREIWILKWLNVAS